MSPCHDLVLDLLLERMLEEEVRIRDRGVQCAPALAVREVRKGGVEGAMARGKSDYVCRHCGARSSGWSGRCAVCGEWGGIDEEAVPRPARVGAPALTVSKPQPLVEVSSDEARRVPSGLGELDRVLGGGPVPGSALLIGGEPGIGKSTLLLQLAAAMASQGRRVLYVTGEESLQQLKLRADRLGIESDDLWVVAETDLDRILAHLSAVQPELLVLDSIQMVARTELPGAPGSVSQVRDCATELVRTAKAAGCTLALIGHVTKDGAIAGPRLLEHIVDVVLTFEGSGDRSYRLLRGVKNRFGPTEEIGVFEMQGRGLVEVENTAPIFLPHGDRVMPPGTVVVPVLEGSRVILVEIQALVARAAYGPPRIKVTGVEANRVAMLLAVIEKRVGLQIADQDVHVNVVGGLRIREPAADLGIALACMSSFVDRRLRPRSVVMGEVGLGGEVRSVHRTPARLKEAAQLGFERVLLPCEPKVLDGAPKALILERADELQACFELALAE